MPIKHTLFLNNNFSVQAEQAEKLLLNKKRREAAEDFAFEFEESLHTLHAHQPSGEKQKRERDPNQFSKTKPKAKQPAPNLTSQKKQKRSVLELTRGGVLGMMLGITLEEAGFSVLDVKKGKNKTIWIQIREVKA